MFLPEVKERAMVACGRRCCLCHKFCGVRIECHHIVQPRDGGDDSFGNCIPLCFDCHAEVGHYTDTHPKGSKFSPQELRQHRDRWYAKVERGISAEAPDHHRTLDRTLFLQLVEVLGGSQEMTHFRDHDYGAIYPLTVDQRLREFSRVASLPETEFFDGDIESALADLRAAVESYCERCSAIVSRHEIQTEYVGIPREWRDGTSAIPDKFHEAVKLLNEHATSVWRAYCQFIKMGRQRLNVELQH